MSGRETLVMARSWLRRAARVLLIVAAVTPRAVVRTMAGAASSPVSGASVRVVNLLRLGSHATPILVFDTTLAGTHQQPIARLPYGSASHTFHPREDDSGTGTTTLSFYRPGPPSNARLLGQWTETLQAGDQVTVLVQPNDDDPKHIPVFTSPEWEHGGTAPLPAASAGSALVIGQGFGLPKSSATTFGVQYGVVGHGCLAPAPDDLGNVSYIGATNTVALTIPLGRQRIGAYSTEDRTCTKKPLAAPVTVTAKAGDRMYLLAYGTPGRPLQLAAVPIPAT